MPDNKLGAFGFSNPPAPSGRQFDLDYDPNPPMGSLVTVKLEVEHLRLIYEKMGEVVPSAVMPGYEYMFEEGTFEMNHLIDSIGDLHVTTTSPGTGGRFPSWEPEPKPKKPSTETRLARALIKKPKLLRDVSRKMQAGDIPLLGPWNAGNGIRWERRYIYHPDEVAVWVEEAADGATRWRMRTHTQADIKRVMPDVNPWGKTSEWSSLKMDDVIGILDEEMMKKGWLLL